MNAYISKPHPWGNSFGLQWMNLPYIWNRAPNSWHPLKMVWMRSHQTRWTFFLNCLGKRKCCDVQYFLTFIFPFPIIINTNIKSYTLPDITNLKICRNGVTSFTGWVWVRFFSFRLNTVGTVLMMDQTSAGSLGNRIREIGGLVKGERSPIRLPKTSGRLVQDLLTFNYH